MSEICRGDTLTIDLQVSGRSSSRPHRGLCSLYPFPICQFGGLRLPSVGIHCFYGYAWAFSYRWRSLQIILQMVQSWWCKSQHFHDVTDFLQIMGLLILPWPSRLILPWPSRTSPCKLLVLGASRNLMSASAMAQSGFQTVFSSVFGVALMHGSKQQPRYVPLRPSMAYISIRNDTGPDPPKTRANEVIIFSRKLGHCPLQTLWETRKVVTGLETLADSHFPRNYVSGNAVQKG